MTFEKSMRQVKWLVPLFLLAALCNAQSQVNDLSTLVGTKAVAQRMPFYQPGTYKEISKDYAGQEVTVIAVKPSAIFAAFPTLSARQLASLTPESRASIDSLRHAATLVVQFADGTKADTGASPIMPSMLPSYLELVGDKRVLSQVAIFPSPIVALPVTTPTIAIVPPLSPSDLTDAQVTAAIDRATHGKRHSIGLTLNDMQTLLLSGMVCETCGTSGYTVTMYTPEQWIEQLTVNAHSEMLPFSAADVLPEMRNAYLRVVALPSRATYITGAGLSMASSVHRVVLSNSDRTETVQPLESANGTTESNSAFRTVTYTSASASFPMSEIIRLQSQDKKGEFFVVVVGDNQNKFFKVKARFMKQLFDGTDH